MKYKILMPTLIALGLSMSGTVHALLIMMPDGTKAEAQVSGNKLMLFDATGKSILARDGTYKTSTGSAIVVQGGIIVTPGVITGAIDSKAKGITEASPQVPSAPVTTSPAGKPGTLPRSAGIATPLAAGGAAPNAVRIDQLASKAQFKALPDDTIIEVDGKSLRKADMVADFNRRAASKSVGPAMGPSTLAATQARLTAEDDAAIAASDADVRKRIAEIRAHGGKP